MLLGIHQSLVTEELTINTEEFCFYTNLYYKMEQSYFCETQTKVVTGRLGVYFADW